MKDFIINILARIIAWSIKRKMKNLGYDINKLNNNRNKLAFVDLIGELFIESQANGNNSHKNKKDISKSMVKIVNSEEDSYNLEEHEKRICSIFKTNKTPKVNGRSLSTYKNYLKININHPCHVTGIEDMGCFGWEEPYALGLWDENEYKEMKKTQASYTDVYDLIRFNDKIDRELGIMVRVKRLSDSKIFTLPLSDLEANDEKSKNYELLNDYSVWFVNNHF